MLRRRTTIICLLIALLGSALLAQRRFRGGPFPFEDDDNVVEPVDANEQTEFVFARLRYPNFRGGNSFWQMRGSWSIDYPKADRQFVQGVRRLTRLHVRSTEHVVSLDDDDIFNYPFVYVVEPGHWDLNEQQAARLRQYLLRGGFLMTDDFHGSVEWDIFMLSLKKAFPDRPVVDIPNNDPIFHVIYDLDSRFQVPGIVNYPFEQTFEQDGVDADWKGMYDENGRLMVAACHNMDLGDAWEWADSPHYPERYASLAYRIGVNYIVYSMTH